MDPHENTSEHEKICLFRTLEYECEGAWGKELGGMSTKNREKKVSYHSLLLPRCKDMISALWLSKLRQLLSALKPHSLSPQTFLSLLSLVLFNHVTYWVTETNEDGLHSLSFSCEWQDTKQGFWSHSNTAGRAGGGKRPWRDSRRADLACRQPQVPTLWR